MNTARIKTSNLSHLLPKFGKRFVTDFKPEAIAAHQAMRLKQIHKPTIQKTKKLKTGSSLPRSKRKPKPKAKPKFVQSKTVNREIGTLTPSSNTRDTGPRCRRV